MIKKSWRDWNREKNYTRCENEWQSHSLGFGESEQVSSGGEDGELLEALACPPDGEVIPCIIGLKKVRK